MILQKQEDLTGESLRHYNTGKHISVLFGAQISCNWGENHLKHDDRSRDETAE